ncbi:MAG: hypothetical protein JEZ01_14900 [Labilibaculum sp.]|nr:hypothetical protein [Labilibaculum sp.]MBI9059051.1 hypothetical protein [Labilibaculum sp.]
MKKLIIILFIFIGLSSCNSKEETIPTCEFTEPLEDLAWLKEYKESLKDCSIQISIFQASYKKQTVFYSAVTDPLANSIFSASLWNCEGEIIITFDYNEREKFNELVTNTIVLHRCKDDGL